eukprot:3352144-Pleurochrysis_carterae.AAC.2
MLSSDGERASEENSGRRKGGAETWLPPTSRVHRARPSEGTVKRTEAPSGHANSAAPVSSVPGAC